MFRFCILQTLYRVILNWPGSMDSIERRNSKINPKQLLFNLSLLHMSERKFIHLVCFSWLHFFHVIFQLLQSRLVCQRGGALWRREEPERGFCCSTSLSSHLRKLFYWETGDLTGKASYLIWFKAIIITHLTRRIPLLDYRGKHLCTIQCNISLPLTL